MKLTKIIKNGFLSAFGVWRNELNNVFGDLGIIILFIVAPLGYPAIYALIYNKEASRETPFVVVDQSHTSLSRAFVHKIDASPLVSVYREATGMDAAQTLIKKKEAYGIVLIPADFSKNIHTGKQATVLYYGDMSVLLFYKNILQAVTEATFEMGDVISPGSENTRPVPYETVSLFNPQNGFASFLIPAILILVIQQTLLFGTGMLAATIRSKNNGQLIPPGTMHQGTLRIVFGKAAAYLTIYSFGSIWALVILPRLFHLITLSTYQTLLAFLLPFLLACIFFAMLVASFIRGRETPMMILAFTSFPFLFLTGISWPTTDIPFFWKIVSYVAPSTFGVAGFVKLNSMGATLQDVALEYRALWLQTGVYFILTCLVYRYNIRKQLIGRIQRLHADSADFRRR
ncbi:MAG: ABC transporter permease [Tannerella sp.]|jgi:ABC-2 type transport system permease protein|nr:ABC transporter permease [Tannerella sp.]